MCREYMGYFAPAKVHSGANVALTGNRPDAARLPYLMDSHGSATFKFNLNGVQTGHPSRLRIHTADQAPRTGTTVQITINGHAFNAELPAGFGIQKTDPAHLAYPSTLTFDLPSAYLKPGTNELTVRVKGSGWFTWDSLDLVSKD
jgi:beta-mannosidase